MPDSRKHFHTRLTLLCFPFLCLLACAIVGITLESARSDLLDGAREMHAAESTVQAIKAKASLIPALNLAERHVVLAHNDFQRARDRLAILAPILERLSWVPLVGNQASAAPVEASLADETAAGILPLIKGVRPLANTFAHDPPGSHATVRFPVVAHSLSAGNPEFRESCRLLRQAQGTRRELHDASRLSAQIGTLDRQLPRLLSLCRVLQLLPELVGVNGPRKYLLAYQNTSELRATGGYLGSASIVTFRDGVVHQQFQGTNFSTEYTLGPSPGPMVVYNDEFLWLFKDSNWSPDFPTTAAIERAFIRLRPHGDVDGVINVTPQAASDILMATGPLYLPEYGREATGRNVAQLADYYTHQATDFGPQVFNNRDTQRKQFIGIVVQHLISRLAELSLPAWLRLASAITSGIGRRDILVNFTNASEQAFLREQGLTGEIDPTSSDYLYVVDSNLSYNKINPDVHLDLSYDVHIRPNRWLRSRLTLRFTNRVSPTAHVRGFGPGFGRFGPPNDYASFVRIYVPDGAQLLSQSGWLRTWTDGPAYGKTMFCGYIIVRAGRTVTIQLNYQIPPNVFSWSHGTRYRLFVQHQPGSHPDTLRVTVTHDIKQTSLWNVLHPMLDWQFGVAITHRPFKPIPLPKQQSFVGPGHWFEPYAYFGTGCRSAQECVPPP